MRIKVVTIAQVGNEASEGFVPDFMFLF